jgi:hypothetical protein
MKKKKNRKMIFVVFFFERNSSFFSLTSSLIILEFSLAAQLFSSLSSFALKDLVIKSKAFIKNIVNDVVSSFILSFDSFFFRFDFFRFVRSQIAFRRFSFSQMHFDVVSVDVKKESKINKTLMRLHFIIEMTRRIETCALYRKHKKC